MPMRYPLLDRANEFLAFTVLRTGACLRLSTAHQHKLGHTVGLNADYCVDMIKRTVYIVCAPACKRYRNWGSMFLRPEDLQKVRVSSLLSPVANTGLGLVY